MPGDSELLVVRYAEEASKPRVYDFSTLPVAEALQSQLADCFRRQVRSGGPWRSFATSKGVWEKIGQFAGWLADNHVAVGDIREVSVDVWSSWELSRPATQGGRRAVAEVGRLLRTHPGFGVEVSKASLRRAAKEVRSEVSYDPTEMRDILRDAKAIFGPAERRIRKHRTILQKFRAGEFARSSVEWYLGECLDSLERTGEVPCIKDWRGYHFTNTRHALALEGVSVVGARKLLFLNAAEAEALQILIAATFGWNESSISKMKLPQITRANAEVSYRVVVLKRRRDRKHIRITETYFDSGSQSPGRLLGRAIAVTAPARELTKHHGQPTDLLLLFRTKRPIDGQVLTSMTDGASTAYKLLTGYRVNMRRIRRHVNVRQKRGPNNNSRRVHDGIYVSREPSVAVEAEAAIASGVGGAIAQAARLSAAVAKEDSNTNETATAGCKNPYLSPFSLPGELCRASFFACLACTNAIIMPRHMGRLLFLRDVLRELQGSLPIEEWNHLWREHLERLEDLRENYYSKDEWEAAKNTLAAEDRLIIRKLILGGLLANV